MGNLKWSFQNCKKEALKYSYRNTFFKNASGAYDACSRHGWLNEACKHMLKYKKYKTPNKEECFTEAKKYKGRNDFCLKSNYLYVFSKKNGWLNEIFPKKLSPKLKECIEEAKDCKSRTEFYKKNRYYYTQSIKMGWLDIVCAHIENKNSQRKRLIYVFEFNDNYTYIGLTYNSKKRYDEHMRNGPIYTHVTETNIMPIFKILTELLPVEEAKIKEIEFIENYKKNNWKLLNKSKGGNIGGCTIRWTHKKCKNLSLLCNSRNEMLKLNERAYRVSLKNNWLIDFFEPKKQIKNRNFWNNKEKCLLIAKGFNSRKEFQTAYPGAYNASQKNGWLNEFFDKPLIKPKGYWNIKENCELECKKYIGRRDLVNHNQSAYHAASFNGWLDEFFGKKRINQFC